LAYPEMLFTKSPDDMYVMEGLEGWNCIGYVVMGQRLRRRVIDRCMLCVWK